MMVHDIFACFGICLPKDTTGLQSLKGLDIFMDLTSYSKEEKEQILTAIGEHRSSKEETSSLSRILYEADKKSRMCFLCPAEKECYWDLSKKNMMIQY